MSCHCNGAQFDTGIDAFQCSDAPQYIQATRSTLVFLSLTLYINTTHTVFVSVLWTSISVCPTLPKPSLCLSYECLVCSVNLSVCQFNVAANGWQYFAVFWTLHAPFHHHRLPCSPGIPISPPVALAAGL